MSALRPPALAPALALGIALAFVRPWPARAADGAPPPPQECRLAGADGRAVRLHMPAGAGQLARHCEALSPFARAGDAAAIERALRALGSFREVSCGVGAVGEAAAMTSCALLPREMVASFALRGRWPWSLFGSDIERRIALRPGTLVADRAAAVATQQERLHNFLQQEGFVDAAVAVDARAIESSGLEQALHVEVGVHASKSLLVRHVEVVGDVVLPTEALAKPFFHRGWFGYQGRFRPVALADDVDRVVERLTDAGYIGSRLEVQVHRHPEAGAVDLTVHVHAGRRLDIDVRGSGPLSARRVRRLAPFAATGSVDGVAAQAYREALERAYQERGYADARVTVSLVPSGRQDLRVQVDVVPNERSSLRGISFRNVPAPVLREALDDVKLLQRRDGRVLHQAYVEGYVTHDAEALAARFGQIGFPHAAVTPERADEGNRQLLSYDVALGTRERTAAIAFVHLPPNIDAEELAEQLTQKPGDPFSPDAVERDRQTLLLAMLRHGYTEAEVQADVTELAPAAAAAQDEGARRRAATTWPTRQMRVGYRFAHGLRARYAGLLPRGNLRTRQSTLVHELPFRLRAPLDLVGIGSARRSLRALNIFHNVTLKPVRPIEGDANTWLQLHVEERDVRTLDGLLGFSSDFLFAVGADLRDANVFGRALLLSAQARLSDASEWVPRTRIGNQDLLQVDLRAPHPLGLPISADAQALYRYQDVREFRERRLGGTVGIERPLLSREACRFCFDLSGRLAYELLEAYRIDKLRGAAPTITRNATIARLVPTLDADRRDSSIDPQSGYHVTLRLEGAHPNLAPSRYLHRRATRFWRVLVSAQGFVPLGRPVSIPLGHGRMLGGPWVLALSTNYGVAQPYGPRGDRQSDVPPSETFGYGGDLSVRGLYARASTQQLPNPLFFTVASAELRLYVLENLGIGSLQVAGFVDVGTVSMDFEHLFAETTVSAGPALRYVTPVGPLSLAYGRALVLPAALRGAAGAAPEYGRVHFTFGYTF